MGFLWGLEFRALGFQERLCVDRYASPYIDIHIYVDDIDLCVCGVHGLHEQDWESSYHVASPIPSLSGLHNEVFLGQHNTDLCGYDWCPRASTAHQEKIAGPSRKRAVAEDEDRYHWKQCDLELA